MVLTSVLTFSSDLNSVEILQRIDLLMKPVKTHPLLNGRLQSIDALRGIAALGIVLYHAVMQTTNAVPNNVFRWPVKLLQFVSSFG